MITKVDKRSVTQVRNTHNVSIPKGWIEIEKGSAVTMWMDSTEPGVIKLRPSTEEERYASYSSKDEFHAAVAGWGGAHTDFTMWLYLWTNPMLREEWGYPPAPDCGHPPCLLAWLEHKSEGECIAQ